MDKDFQEVSKESYSENNNISVAAEQEKSLSIEERKELEITSYKDSVNNTKDCIPRHSHRVTASHSTIEHVGGKSGDSKRAVTGHPRSKSFLEQLPMSKGPSLTRSSFNGKKGIQGSHGDGLLAVSHPSGKGSLLNESLVEKGEDQQKKQHILHSSSCINSTRVAQRLFDSSLSFADLVRACGQRQKRRLHTVQLNNSLLSTPQSSTLVSNYFNKYRSYLDHLRKTYEHDDQESVNPNIRPQVTSLSLPLACMTPIFSDEIVQDPDYAQILEKTTTESIRNLWSYKTEGGKADISLHRCNKIEKRPSSENRQNSNKRSFASGDSPDSVQGNQILHNRRQIQTGDVFVIKTESQTSLKSKEKFLYSDCMQDCISKPEARKSPDVQISPLETNQDVSDTMKNNMASLLPHHNGTSEWGDNERKTQSIGYSFRLRNQSAIDTLVQNQQRMIQQKQQEQQQQQLQPDNIQSEAQPHSLTLQNNNMNKTQGGSHSRHKICSRFQGMLVSATSASSSPATNSYRGILPNSATSGIHGSLANTMETTNVIGSQAQSNGIYPSESMTDDDTNTPNMSGTMAYTRTLKASYACLDPNGTMPMPTEDEFDESIFADVENVTLPNAFRQTLETLEESKWRDVQSRQIILNGDKNEYGHNCATPTNTQDRPRTTSGFLEPEQTYQWSTGGQKASQRPIIKVNKDSDFEPYMYSCGQKEKNGFSLAGDLNDPSVSQKHWGSFSLPNSNCNRIDTSHDVTDGFITSKTNGNSRLHQWRQDLSSFGSLNYQGRGSLLLTSQGGFPEATIGQRSDTINYSSDATASLEHAPSTKGSWSTYEDVSPDKIAQRYQQRPQIMSLTSESLDNGRLPQAYRSSRLGDPRHKLFNNNNASGLFVNGKNRQHYDTNSFGASEPWSNATCDDMTEYFDSSLQFGNCKSDTFTSHITTPTISVDVNSSKGLPLNYVPINYSCHSSQSLLDGYGTSTSTFDNSYNTLQPNRMSSNCNIQKDAPHSSASFSDLTSLQLPDQKIKQEDFKRNSDDHIFLPHDLKPKTLDKCNQFDVTTSDTKTLSSPWYELAPAPEDTEEIRNDKTVQPGPLNFLENTGRETQFRTNATSDINHVMQQSFVSMSSPIRNIHGNQRLENKPRLILGANTINRKRHDEETDSIPDNERNGVLGPSAHENVKMQHLKTFPFPCQAKNGCPSSSNIAVNQFQTPQFQMAGIKHQQSGGVPQQMYCIPNILVPPPNQGQGRHPGLLSYPGMMGNMAASSHFPQGVVRVPLVDMSRLVYVQSLPFNTTASSHTPNSNHNNSSSSNPHVNTSNIITINTADNDFSLTGDKGGNRATKTAGIRGKGTLLRLRPNNTVSDSSLQGLRSTDDCLLSKGAKTKTNRNPWDADLEHDFSSSLFSKVTTIDQSRLNTEFGLVYPEGQTGSNSVSSETTFRSASGVHWPTSPDIHPEMLDMLPVRKQPIEDYSGRQVCWPDMELVMSSTREQLQVVRKSNKPLGSNKANLISILPKAVPGDLVEARGKELGFDQVEI